MRWFLLTLALVALGALAYLSLSHPSSVTTRVTPPPASPSNLPRSEVVGSSVQGRPIYAYNYGTGSSTLLLVGGMHGGYEWNSVLLAYQAMDYL